MCSGCARPAADLLGRIEDYCNLSSLLRLRGFGQRSSAGPLTEPSTAVHFVSSSPYRKVWRGWITAEVFPPLLWCARVTIIHRGGGTIVPFTVNGPIAAESSFSVVHSVGTLQVPQH